MYLDVVDLQEFYNSRLGVASSILLRRKIENIWPSVKGQRVLGLGYALPFLKPFLGEAERVVALMPAPQGVTRWPRGKPNLAALTEETRLPVPDAMFDRVILVHALENAEQIRPFIREIWRVMAPEGRLLMVVPNRRGLWSRNERTPFGWGHPYSRSQLKRFLNESMLSPVRWERSLYLPPMRSSLGIQSLAAVERIGDTWLRRFAGIIMVEAEKRVYAQPNTRRTAAVRKFKPVLASAGSAREVTQRESLADQKPKSGK